MKNCSFLYKLILLFCLFLLASCSNDDGESMLDFSEVQGKPIEFDFKGITTECSITRSTPLPTTVTVWITTNGGNNWYPYIWDNDKNLWKPKSTAVTWTSKTMTIYAVVRGDTDTWDDIFTIQPDQSDYSSLMMSDFLGARQHVTYKTGRVSMTLEHRVAKLAVQAQMDQSDNKDNLFSCVTTTGGSYQDATDPGTYPTTGRISCGDANVDLTGIDSPVSYFTLYKDSNAELIDDVSGLQADRTATFYAYLIPLTYKIRPFFTFKYLNGTSVYTYTPGLTYNQGGMALDGGCISCCTIFMPNVP